jgi:hypothetical protein
MDTARKEGDAALALAWDRVLRVALNAAVQQEVAAGVTPLPLQEVPQEVSHAIRS